MSEANPQQPKVMILEWSDVDPGHVTPSCEIVIALDRDGRVLELEFRTPGTGNDPVGPTSAVEAATAAFRFGARQPGAGMAVRT